MNIEKLSDQEKSVMLAKLMGWEVVDIGFGQSAIMPEGGSILTSVADLYDPTNMALAWRVHCWLNVPGDMNKKFDVFWKYDDLIGNLGDQLYSPDFQRAFLDEILSLAIDAGMVKEAGV